MPSSKGLCGSSSRSWDAGGCWAEKRRFQGTVNNKPLRMQLPATCQCTPDVSLTSLCHCSDLSSANLAQSEDFAAEARFLLDKLPCRVGLSHGQTCSSSCWQQTTFILCHMACVGFFCSRESQVSLQDSAVTDARARSEARLKLLSVILYFELGYQGWGEQALPFCHPWFARVCLV